MLFRCLACAASGQPDYNNISTRWCSNNAVETGDSQPGAPSGQCDIQAQSATTIYSLYIPDSTPWYFNDDVVAPNGIWTVPASPITGTDPISGFGHSYVYSQTWSNFNDAPGPGYHLIPINGNHQWRLNVNVPLDNDHTILGVAAQNNYAIRVQTSQPGVKVSAFRRLPTVNEVSGTNDFYITKVPAYDGGRTLTVSLFDVADFAGTNYIQLIAPPDATHVLSYPVIMDTYVQDKYYPPGPDIVHYNVERLDTSRPANDTNDRWAHLV